MAKKSRLEVILWNVYEGHDPKHVREETEDMIKKHNPDLFIYVEATNLHGRLDGLGYRTVHMKSRSRRKGHKPETANVAILVRRNLNLKNRSAIRMKETWIGPKNGFKRDPRVHRAVRVRKKGVTWKVGGFHFPFGKKARDESIKAVRKFLRKTKGKRPTLALGDFQMRRPALLQKIANKPKVNAKVTGIRIDGAIFKNAKLVEMKNLGPRGSDHPAIKLVFEASK